MLTNLQFINLLPSLSKLQPADQKGLAGSDILFKGKTLDKDIFVKQNNINFSASNNISVQDIINNTHPQSLKIILIREKDLINKKLEFKNVGKTTILLNDKGKTRKLDVTVKQVSEKESNKEHFFIKYNNQSLGYLSFEKILERSKSGKENISEIRILEMISASNGNLKTIGRKLHQIAVEKSILLDCPGKLKFYVWKFIKDKGSPIIFHLKNGYIPVETKDISNIIKQVKETKKEGKPLNSIELDGIYMHLLPQNMSKWIDKIIEAPVLNDTRSKLENNPDWKANLLEMKQKFSSSKYKQDEEIQNLLNQLFL